MQREADTFFASRTAGADPTYDDIMERFPYTQVLGFLLLQPLFPLTMLTTHARPRPLQSAFLEALRLYPSVPKDSKQAIADDTLPSGERIPAGSHVCVLEPNAANQRCCNVINTLFANACFTESTAPWPWAALLRFGVRMQRSLSQSACLLKPAPSRPRSSTSPLTPDHGHASGNKWRLLKRLTFLRYSHRSSRSLWSKGTKSKPAIR